ncbi:MAG: DUF4843 domain-containing protein [Odoribacter sp.]
MKKCLYYITTILTILLCGCENDSLLYQGESDGTSGIYFKYSAIFNEATGIYSYIDSVEYSFANDPLSVTKRIQYVNVLVFGNIANYDRTYKARIIGGTAVEGVDYEPLKEEYTIPAGKSLVNLPIVLLRTAKLQKEKLNLIVKLEENQYFRLWMPDLETGAEKTKIDITKFKVTFSEFVAQPEPVWTMFAQSIFGTFSVKKFRMINELSGWKPSNWYWLTQGGENLYPKFPYNASLLQINLQELADAKTPMYEDDGVTLMQLAGKYKIDYSGLENNNQ